MKNRYNSAFFYGVGNFSSEHVTFSEGYCAGVLHRARVEFRHEHLVVFFERIRHAELRFEEFESLAGFFKDVVGVKIFG